VYPSSQLANVSGGNAANTVAAPDSLANSDIGLLVSPSRQLTADPTRSNVCRLIEKGPENVTVSEFGAARCHSKRAVSVLPSNWTANFPMAVQGLNSNGTRDRDPSSNDDAAPLLSGSAGVAQPSIISRMLPVTQIQYFG